MKTAAKAIALAIVVVGIAVWIWLMLPPLRTGVDLDVHNLPQGEIANPLPSDEDGRTTLEGIVIFEHSDQPVPYLQYSFQGKEVRTKQLILAHGRGCSPANGDLPCADGSEGDYPDLAYGQRIRVTGTIKGDQLYVESIEPL